MRSSSSVTYCRSSEVGASYGQTDQCVCLQFLCGYMVVLAIFLILGLASISSVMGNSGSTPSSPNQNSPTTDQNSPSTAPNVRSPNIDEEVLIDNTLRSGESKEPDAPSDDINKVENANEIVDLLDKYSDTDREVQTEKSTAQYKSAVKYNIEIPQTPSRIKPEYKIYSTQSYKHKVTVETRKSDNDYIVIKDHENVISVLKNGELGVSVINDFTRSAAGGSVTSASPRFILNGSSISPHLATLILRKIANEVTPSQQFDRSSSTSTATNTVATADSETSSSKFIIKVYDTSEAYVNKPDIIVDNDGLKIPDGHDMVKEKTSGSVNIIKYSTDEDNSDNDGQEKAFDTVTKQGKIKGRESEHKLYYEFIGIPYATPVQFRAPVEAPPFENIFKATSNEFYCPQFSSNDPFGGISDDEKCLFLNIFTPNPFSPNTSLPVMLYLHGGDFGVGSGNPKHYGPQYLVSHGVVVITINYRLNAYGFLNLGIKEAPGNAGLKDIRAALKWVKANIEHFGGDPDNITVFGQGSGGIAAIYLMLSDSTNNLIRRVISQSGTPFAPYSFDVDPLAAAKKVAQSLGTTSHNVKVLYRTFAQTSVMKVEEAISKQLYAKSVFLPSVEKVYEDDDEPFLTDTPYNILTSKRKPFKPLPMIFCRNEYDALKLLLDEKIMVEEIDKVQRGDLSVLNVRNLLVPYDTTEDFQDNVLRVTFSNGTRGHGNALIGILRMHTELAHFGPSMFFTEIMHNMSAPFYVYTFQYKGHRNLGHILASSRLAEMPFDGTSWTMYLDELAYLFEIKPLKMAVDDNDHAVIVDMTNKWTSFAKLQNFTSYFVENVKYPPSRTVGVIDLKSYPIHYENRHIFPYLFKKFFLKYGAEILY